MIFGPVAELGDALDLGSSTERRVGSSPSRSTIKKSVSIQNGELLKLVKGAVC